MAGAKKCPDDQSLRQLLHGPISDTAASLLEEHLLECDSCVERTKALEANGDLIRIVQSASSLEQPGGADLANEQLVRKLHGLRTSGSVAASQSTVDGAEAGPNGRMKADTPSHERGVRDPDSDLEGDGDCLAPPEQPDEIGRLGSYRVLGVLGRGGMGVVYRAEDPMLRRPVALKVMRGKAAQSPTGRERFLREARAAAAVRHVHVVTIYQVGDDHGVPFIALEFLEGQPLDKWLDENPRPRPMEIVRIGREIAEGLAAAHVRGLIHRDIKPANIWLEESSQNVKILDFGLARPADEARLTQEGQAVGTPAYMSPEQARGHAVDHRTDLFSVGVLLYELCAGELPFNGPTTMAILSALALDEPAPVGLKNMEIPTELADLIHRLLCKNAADRPASAAELAKLLSRIEMLVAAPNAVPSKDDQGMKAGLPAGARQSHRARSKRAIAAGLLGLVAIVVLVAIIIQTRNTDRKDPATKGSAGEAAAIGGEQNPAEEPRIAPQEWTNVLRAVDPAAHSVVGNWAIADGGLVVGHQEYSRLVLPVMPKGNYELRIRMSRRSGDAEINFILPVGNTSCIASIWDGGKRAGFQLPGSPVLTSPSELFLADHPQTVLVRVVVDDSEAKLDLEIEGKIPLRWRGAIESVKQRQVWCIPHGCLGLGAHDDGVVFHSIEMRMLSGTARPYVAVQAAERLEANTPVDMLSLVDVPRHRFVGQWNRTDKGIRGGGGTDEFARLAIPVLPDGSYEFDVRLKRISGDADEMLILPVGRTACICAIFPDRIELEMKPTAGRGSTIGDVPNAPLTPGQEYGIIARVALAGGEATIQVDIDGKRCIDWTGPQWALSPREDWRLFPNSLGIGTYNESTLFREARLKVVTGKATYLKWPGTPDRKQ